MPPKTRLPVPHRCTRACRSRGWRRQNSPPSSHLGGQLSRMASPPRPNSLSLSTEYWANFSGNIPSVESWSQDTRQEDLFHVATHVDHLRRQPSLAPAETGRRMAEATDSSRLHQFGCLMAVGQLYVNFYISGSMSNDMYIMTNIMTHPCRGLALSWPWNQHHATTNFSV